MKIRRGDVDTGARILDAALALFRKRGFERTTMRDVAAAAGLSLGAAYHYFSSKDALVVAYFVRNQEASERLSHERLAGLPDAPTEQRIACVIHASLEILTPDRKLLGTLFRTVADPEDPLSPFHPTLADVRARSMALFALAVGERAPADLRGVLPPALWGLMMASILAFVHDRTTRQTQTKALVDGACGLVGDLLRVAALPGLEAMRARVVHLAELVSGLSPAPIARGRSRAAGRAKRGAAGDVDRVVQR